MLKEYMTEEDRKKKEEAKKNKENKERGFDWRSMRYKDSNSRRSMIVYSSKSSSILIPLHTLVSKLDSSLESGSKMD